MTQGIRGVVPGVLLAIGISASAAAQDEPSVEQQVKDLESRIAAVGQHDPQHPEALEARLDYAHALAGFANEDCAWVPKSQAQLDTLMASPVTRILLPDGEARLAAIEYRILTQKANCTEDPEEDTRHTRAALEKARVSMAAYERAYDYLDMAIMQFNIATAHQRLGEEHRALAELEKAIEIGKTYGLRADVEENYGYLQEWRGEEKDPAAIRKLMDAWPLRKASFRFAWQPGSTRQRLEMDSAEIVGGKVIHARTAVGGKSIVARKGKEWLLSGEYAPIEVRIGEGDRGDEASRKMTDFMTRAFANLPTVIVTAEGEFKDMPELEAFSARVDGEARAFGKRLFPPNDPRLQQFEKAYEGNIAPRLKPDVLRAHQREAFNLQVAVWTGATLEHGERYEMPSALSMPGTPQGQLDHKLEFTVTRWLPCTSAETEPRCVEIVLHGIPDANAVAATMDNLATRNAPLAPWQYWARTVLRLVTDPSTLTPYGTDVRRYSYIGYKGQGGRAQEIKAERQVTTTIVD